MTRRLSLEEATGLAARAARAAGLSDEAALSLARATVSANAHGKSSSGFSHLMDYLPPRGRAASTARRAARDFASAGRDPLRRERRDRPTRLRSRLRRSLPPRRNLWRRDLRPKGSYTTGELGYYPRRLAEAGLVAFAATSGPALMTVAGAKKPVYCTNPFAFAAPVADGPPLLIDQASSATAFVQLRHYAERGEALPPGWAVDAEGEPTTDPHAALRGALLAFGGARGANIALMVEVMAAGLAGANWALDAPPFTSGNRSPGAGLTIIAIAPALLSPDFSRRLRLELDRLATLGVHIPGRRAAATAIDLPDALVSEIERAGAP